MMQAYDNLPRRLRDFYKNYCRGKIDMKKVHMADHFDDPTLPILASQVEAELKIHEMLFHVTLSRRPHRLGNSEHYHPTDTFPGGFIFWDSWTT